MGFIEVEKREDKGAEVFERVRGGDDAAFTELYQMYSRAMVNYSYRFLGNWHEAEEATQEIFLRLFRVAPRYERRAQFSTFIYQVATNILINWLRDHSRERDWVSFDDLASGLGQAASQEQDLEQRILFNRVAQGVACLPERERACLIMVAMEGLSYEEAALAMRVSSRAVKSLVHRARERVRAQLKEEEGK